MAGSQSTQLARPVPAWAGPARTNRHVINCTAVSWCVLSTGHTWMLRMGAAGWTSNFPLWVLTYLWCFSHTQRCHSVSLLSKTKIKQPSKQSHTALSIYLSAAVHPAPKQRGSSTDGSDPSHLTKWKPALPPYLLQQVFKAFCKHLSSLETFWQRWCQLPPPHNPKEAFERWHHAFLPNRQSQSEPTAKSRREDGSSGLRFPILQPHFTAFIGREETAWLLFLSGNHCDDSAKTTLKHGWTLCHWEVLYTCNISYLLIRIASFPLLGNAFYSIS